MTNQLTSISPIDGRYLNSTKELQSFFSEAALMRYRLKIEIEYLIALSKEKSIKELKAISSEEQTKLRNIYKNFSLKNAAEIKKTEKTTNHDVKAIEYYLKEDKKKRKKGRERKKGGKKKDWRKNRDWRKKGGK